MKRTTFTKMFADRVLRTFECQHPRAAARSKRLHLHSDDMATPKPRSGWRPISTTTARLARCRAVIRSR